MIVSPKFQNHSMPIPVVVGQLRAESQTDANDGLVYVLVFGRGGNGLAQAHLSKTIGKP